MAAAPLCDGLCKKGGKADRSPMTPATELIWNFDGHSHDDGSPTMNADIVKVSEEELAMLTGCSIDDYERAPGRSPDSGKTAVFCDHGRQRLLLSHPRTSMVLASGLPGRCSRYHRLRRCLYGNHHYFLCHHPEMKVSEMVRYASAVGALCASAVGAIPALPLCSKIGRLLWLCENKNTLH